MKSKKSRSNPRVIKGGELELVGDKKSKGGFFGNLFGSKEDRIDDACEIYK